MTSLSTRSSCGIVPNFVVHNDDVAWLMTIKSAAPEVGKFHMITLVRSGNSKVGQEINWKLFQKGSRQHTLLLLYGILNCTR